MTASSTISKEDFKELQDNLELKWKTEFKKEKQPFKVIFTETSEDEDEDEDDLFDEGVEKLPDTLQEGVEKLAELGAEQWTTLLNQTCIQTSINNLTKRPNHTEG